MMNSFKILLLLAIVCLSWATITAAMLDRTVRHHHPDHDSNGTERFNGTREVRHHHPDHDRNETERFNGSREVRHHHPDHDRNETERFNGTREVRHHHPHHGNETGNLNNTRNVRQSPDNVNASTTTGPSSQWGGQGGPEERPPFGGPPFGGFPFGGPPFGGPPFGGPPFGGPHFGGPEGRPPFGGQQGPGGFNPTVSGGPSDQPQTVTPSVVRRHHRPGHNGTQEG